MGSVTRMGFLIGLGVAVCALLALAALADLRARSAGVSNAERERWALDARKRRRTFQRGILWRGRGMGVRGMGRPEIDESPPGSASTDRPRAPMGAQEKAARARRMGASDVPGGYRSARDDRRRR